MNQSHSPHIDAPHIDATLTALRNVQPPAGLEERVLRSAQARATRRAAAPSRRLLQTITAAWQPLTIGLATAAIAAAIFLKLATPPTPHLTTARATPAPITTTGTSTMSHPADLSSRPKRSGAERPAATQALIPAASATQPTLSAADQQLLDDIHAPSHPAPPQPLTAQERLLLRSTRPGQPLEVAQLEPLRESELRAAAASSRSITVQQYVQNLLAPLAFAENFHPTPSNPAPEEQPTAPDAAPDSNQP